MTKEERIIEINSIIDKHYPNDKETYNSIELALLQQERNVLFMKIAKIAKET